MKVGDFLLLHLLGQNVNISSYGEILRGLCERIDGNSGSGTPSAPSTLELPLFYSNLEGNEKETMT